MITVDLFNQSNDPLLELSTLSSGYSWSTSRNEADSIDIDIPIKAFKDLCSTINEIPGNFLIPWKTVLKVRDTDTNTFLASGYFTYASQSLSVSGETLSLHADGFLNVFQKRRITRFFDSALDASVIFADILDDMQTGTNRDLGFSIGTSETVGTLSQKTFAGITGKKAFQDLTTLEVATFDFRFNHDKTIDIVKTLGSTKSIVLAYPGLIISANPPFDARNMVNSVTAFGSGFGGSDIESQLLATAEDTVSQLDYVLLEDYIISNAQVELDEIQADADSYLANWKDPVTVCPITVDFNRSELVATDVTVGDYVTVDLSQGDIFSTPAIQRRIEKMEMSLDSNGSLTGVLTVI